MRLSMMILPLLVALPCAGGAVFAQYSADPSTPLALRATAGDDVQPKIVAAPDGGQYVSYFSGPGYDVYLDRLDADGASVWGKPLLVEDRTLSSTVDYGLASDGAGNAYVCFNGSNSGQLAQKVVAVSAEGEILWSSSIVEVASGTLANGRVAVASDGAIWGGCVLNATSVVQRFDRETGAATLQVAVVLVEGGANMSLADLQPSADGAAIASCVRNVGFAGARTLRAHKLLSDGTLPWGSNGKSVFANGSIQIGNFPGFLPDGQGGAYFAWYTTSPLQCRVQRMDVDGAMLYGVDGAAVSATTTIERTNPSALVGADGRLYVAFRTRVPPVGGIAQYGIYVQAFEGGVRQWGDDGAAVAPNAAVFDRKSPTAVRLGDAVGATYVTAESAIEETAKAARLDAKGGLAWTVDLATDAGTKFRFSSNPAAPNASVVVWQGGPDFGASDVFAARIDADGALGPPKSMPTGDLNGDGVVNAADLAILLGAWGGSGAGDLDGDGVVGAADLAILLGAWSS